MEKIYRYLFLVIFSLTTYCATAQKGFHVGADGAFNLTFIINQNNYGGPEYEYAPTFGYSYGFATGYNFDRHFGLQAEIKGSKQGQHYEDKINGYTVKRNVDLYYTHIPILFKYSGGGDYAIRFYVMAGPQFSYLNKATESFSSPDSSNSVTWTNRYNRNDVQFVFDMGSDFTVAKNLYASTGIRLNYGFNDINANGWKIQDPNRTHEISQNALGGIHVGLHYMLFNNDAADTK